MEPITSLSYILTSFFGYYIGADMYNYVKIKYEFNAVKNSLDNIILSLNLIDSKLDKINVFHKIHNPV
jgi:hypothetical protein